jgi:hypothetical protein
MKAMIIIFAIGMMSMSPAEAKLRCKFPAQEILVSYTYDPGTFKIGSPACCDVSNSFVIRNEDQSKRCSKSRGVVYDAGRTKLCCPNPGRGIQVK